MADSTTYDAAQLLADVQTYLGNDYDSSMDSKINLLIRNVIITVCNKRFVKPSYTDDERDAVIKKYYDTIFQIVIYLWDKQGAEGETSHSENGTNRSYANAYIPASMLVDIVPIAYCI